MTKPKRLSLSYVQSASDEQGDARSLTIGLSAGNFERLVRFSSEGAPLAETGDALLCLGLPLALD